MGLIFSRIRASVIMQLETMAQLLDLGSKRLGSIVLEDLHGHRIPGSVA
jgi:hypothetical protein